MKMKKTLDALLVNILVLLTKHIVHRGSRNNKLSCTFPRNLLFGANYFFCIKKFYGRDKVVFHRIWLKRLDIFDRLIIFFSIILFFTKFHGIFKIACCLCSRRLLFGYIDSNWFKNGTKGLSNVSKSLTN